MNGPKVLSLHMCGDRRIGTVLPTLRVFNVGLKKLPICFKNKCPIGYMLLNLWVKPCRIWHYYGTIIP